MAKIYPFNIHKEVPWRQQMKELRSAFSEEYLAFFIQALDTSTRMGGNTPRGLKVMQRAYAFLTEAKNQLEREFDK